MKSLEAQDVLSLSSCLHRQCLLQSRVDSRGERVAAGGGRDGGTDGAVALQAGPAARQTPAPAPPLLPGQRDPRRTQRY